MLLDTVVRETVTLWCTTILPVLNIVRSSVSSKLTDPLPLLTPSIVSRTGYSSKQKNFVVPPAQKVTLM